MKKVMTPKCKRCGERRFVGNTNGIPNMIGFQLDDGTTINLCNLCLMKLGSLETETEKEEFFKELGV